MGQAEVARFAFAVGAGAFVAALFVFGTLGFVGLADQAADATTIVGGFALF